MLEFYCVRDDSSFCLFVDNREAAVVLEGPTYVESVFVSLIPRFLFAVIGMDDDTAAKRTHWMV